MAPFASLWRSQLENQYAALCQKLIQFATRNQREGGMGRAREKERGRE